MPFVSQDGCCQKVKIYVFSDGLADLPLTPSLPPTPAHITLGRSYRIAMETDIVMRNTQAEAGIRTKATDQPGPGARSIGRTHRAGTAKLVTGRAVRLRSFCINELLLPSCVEVQYFVDMQGIL